MQNYNQQPQGYQRPGSTASFTGAPPPPPPYVAPQGYQSTAPSTNSQWAPPAQTTTPAQQQWGQTSGQGSWGQQQPPPAAPGYNPGTYGVMSGGYAQSQQQDQPPPPPPKPHGFAAAVQQQGQPAQQNWGQQSAYGGQQSTGYASQGQDFSHQGHQGGYPAQQAGFQNQGVQQQPYSNTAPPPPSQTPGGSYFPPSQGRPGSIYGADQAGTYSTPSSAVAQHPPNTVLSPNEQQPAYIPPSLTGQGVQSYQPANTNPLPGVYVPPPPDIPAWQQASHAPLQGTNKKFKYTKPSVDPTFYAQGYQASQPAQQYGQPAPDHLQHQGKMHAGQFVQPNQPLAQQFTHPDQQQQPPPIPQHPQYNQTPHGQPTQPPPGAQFQQHGDQWSQPAQPGQPFAQQQQPNAPVSYGGQESLQMQQYATSHVTQQTPPVAPQQYSQAPEHDIPAPKPLGRTGTVPLDFVNQMSPESQPVSPVQVRHSVNFGTDHGLGRTGSVSSIALGAIRNQQAQSAAATGAPAPAPATKVPTPPPPRDNATAFSVLAAGGPSDWEHFGAGVDEIDDEELFGAKKEEKQEPELPASVELPGSHPSPPSTVADWPTPEVKASHPAAPNAEIQRRDTYQPTPPPNAATPAQRLPSQPPQNTYVMGDAVVSAQSPQPHQVSEPPPATQGLVMDNGGWVPPKRATPTQPQQYAPPPAQQNFVMDNGGWSAQSMQVQRQQTPIQARQQTPAQQQQYHQPPPVTMSSVMGDSGWGGAQQAPTQGSSGWDVQAQKDSHVAELKAKDDAYEHLRAGAEKDKADLRAEIERLKADTEKEKADLHVEIEKIRADIDSVRGHALSEKAVLNEQIESMKIVADKAKSDADALMKEKDAAFERSKQDMDALVKEKDATMERLKEDAEGRDELIKAKDAEIVALKQQLEVEKTKEVPKPTPAALISDIDPWYAGSLERYINMLRSEAAELQVENKINVFQGFLRAESAIRGLEYYTAPPPAPVSASPTATPLPVPLSTTSNNESDAHSKAPSSPSSTRRPSVQIQTQRATDQSQHQHRHFTPAQHSMAEDEAQYSPGGRPIMAPSRESTTILTPTSSTDDDFNKTPVQSPPEDSAHNQYKAYVPPVAAATPIEPVHRQSLSYASPPSILPSTSSPGKHDEIFFGDSSPASKPTSRPTTSTSSISDVLVPAPLSFTPQPPAGKATPKKSPLEALAELLPKQIAFEQSNSHLEEIRKQMQAIPSDFAHIAELTAKWEKAAALQRRKNDDARHKRQEESEAHTDELFNNNEISYADIGDIEDEFKEKERQLKAQEDRDEYKSYVEEVFDKVYDGLQGDIKTLMDFHIETEALLHSSAFGTDALEASDTPTTQQCLELLRDLHEAIELRHEKVVVAVAERDKRYKKTEIQPLYAAGNIGKMKNVEKHFENAEKQAVVRATGEKADRIGELVKIAEEVVVGAVSGEQGEADKILNAIKAVETEDGQEEVLKRARETILAIKQSSQALLTLFNALEMQLNTDVISAEIAQAKAENSDTARIAELERELHINEMKMKEEFQRRIAALEQDKKEVDRLVESKGANRLAESKGAKVQLSEEEEKKRRMKVALEEAKRRNGHA